MNRLQNIQALRGIAVLSVVFFHLVVIESKYGGLSAILPDWLRFGMFGVDLFFVISGFVMVTVTRGKFRDLKQSLLFLYHRVSRIYPLYWVYTTLALIVFIVQPSWVNSSQGNQVNIAASYLLIPSKLLPIVLVGWTLIHEMYFYLVLFFILLLVPERYFAPTLLFWGAVVAFSHSRGGNPFEIVIFHPLTLEFIAGCLLAVHYHNSKEIKANGVLLLVIAGIALIAAVSGYIHYNRMTGLSPLGWSEVLYYGIPATVIVFCATHAERNGIVLPGFLIQAGNASYSIYLSHLFTVNVVGRVWSIFTNDSAIFNGFALSAAFVLALIGGFVSYRLIEIPLLKLTRRIA